MDLFLDRGSPWQRFHKFVFLNCQIKSKQKQYMWLIDTIAPMKRVKPTEFRGPRGYFTDIDPKIVNFKKSREKYHIEVERRLKINLLSKGFIVCAASHLPNEFSYDIFSNNPILLEKNMVIPALRNDKLSIGDYIKINNRSQKSIDIQNYYRDNVNAVVSWELVDNSSWFKRTLIQSLCDNKSVIYPNFSHVDYKSVQKIIPKIQENDIISREIIMELIDKWPQKDKIIMIDYVNLIYHISGSRVINCESLIPRENYIDYSLSDYAEKRTNLSDTNTFIKLIFEIGFESVCGNQLPLEVLDLLTFEDIYHMTKSLRNSTFRIKYDNFISSYLYLYNQNNLDIMELLQEIDHLKKEFDEIAETFSKVMDKEKEEFMKDRHLHKKKAFYMSSMALFSGLCSTVPYMSILSTPVELTKYLKEFIVNLYGVRDSKEEMKNYSLYLKNRQLLLYQYLDEYQINENYVFVDTVKLIGDTLASKMTIK